MPPPLDRNHTAAHTVLFAAVQICLPVVSIISTHRSAHQRTTPLHATPGVCTQMCEAIKKTSKLCANYIFYGMCHETTKCKIKLPANMQYGVLVNVLTERMHEQDVDTN